MHDSSGDSERPAALRPFDKTTFNEIHDQLRPAINALKAASKTFYNQDALAHLLQIGQVGLESAHKILLADPVNFSAETTAAVGKALTLLADAQTSERARMERVAEINFESQIETAATGLAEAGKSILGRDLTRDEYAALKDGMREVFLTAKRTGLPPDAAALTSALTHATTRPAEAPAHPAATAAAPPQAEQRTLLEAARN